LKQYFTLGIIAIQISLLIPFTTNGADTKDFIVTAYYSPLPDQEYYITGNYEDELRLNGQGIA